MISVQRTTLAAAAGSVLLLTACATTKKPEDEFTKLEKREDVLPSAPSETPSVHNTEEGPDGGGMVITDESALSRIKEIHERCQEGFATVRVTRQAEAGVTKPVGEGAKGEDGAARNPRLYLKYTCHSPTGP